MRRGHVLPFALHTDGTDDNDVRQLRALECLVGRGLGLARAEHRQVERKLASPEDALNVSDVLSLRVQQVDLGRLLGNHDARHFVGIVL